MNELTKIKNAILDAKTILITAHIDPDGDAIGSMLALYVLLQKKAKKVKIYSKDAVPNNYKFLPFVNKIKHQIFATEQFDLAITVDAGDIKRIGDEVNLKHQAKTIINIDHHSDNTLYGNINYVKVVSSTAELIYKLSIFLKIKINKAMATCLFAAVMTDTGNFKYENTNESTFEFAKELTAAGANPSEIAREVYENKSLSSVKILASALQNLESFPKGNVVWASITRKQLENSQAKDEDLTGVIDHLRSIHGAEIAILFREDDEPGKIKINFRSKSKANVQKIAKELGGGGHIRAAGVIVDGDLEKVKQKTLNIILKHI